MSKVIQNLIRTYTFEYVV